MSDDGFYGVAALDEFALRFAQALRLSAMDDCQLRVVAIHTAAAQIDECRAWFLDRVLHENAGLLDLFVQCLLNKRRTGVGSGSDEKVAQDVDRYADPIGSAQDQRARARITTKRKRAMRDCGTIGALKGGRGDLQSGPSGRGRMIALEDRQALVHGAAQSDLYWDFRTEIN